MSHRCVAHHCSDPYCHCQTHQCADKSCHELISGEPGKRERQAWECEMCGEFFCEDHTVDLFVGDEFLWAKPHCFSCAMTRQLAELSMGNVVFHDQVALKIRRINDYVVREFGSDPGMMGSLELSLILAGLYEREMIGAA